MNTRRRWRPLDEHDDEGEPAFFVRLIGAYVESTEDEEVEHRGQPSARPLPPPRASKLAQPVAYMPVTLPLYVAPPRAFAEEELPVWRKPRTRSVTDADVAPSVPPGGSPRGR